MYMLRHRRQATSRPCGQQHMFIDSTTSCESCHFALSRPRDVVPTLSTRGMPVSLCLTFHTRPLLPLPMTHTFFRSSGPSAPSTVMSEDCSQHGSAQASCLQWIPQLAKYANVLQLMLTHILGSGLSAVESPEVFAAERELALAGAGPVG